MVSSLFQKRPAFIIKTKRDLEFIDPKAHEKELPKRDPKWKPERQSQYDNMRLIYKDVYMVNDEDRKKDPSRNYHDNVIKYFTDEDGDIEVPLKCKADAKYILNIAQRLDSSAFLDVKNGMSFEEVPDDSDESVLVPVPGTRK